MQTLALAGVFEHLLLKSHADAGVCIFLIKDYVVDVHESRNVTARLKIGAPGLESMRSATK
jgi:hypothetical protein